jgi:hypothetical protein
MKMWRTVIVLVGLIALLSGGDLFGCPNCKDGVNTADPDGLNIARGYFYSILLMLAMPFTLAGSFAAYVWREMRRQKRLAEADSPMQEDTREQVLS